LKKVNVCHKIDKVSFLIIMPLNWKKHIGTRVGQGDRFHVPMKKKKQAGVD
jgi:hypothetical protein